MPDNNETGPRKPRGTRKASRPAIADDWATLAENSERAAAPTAAAPERQRIAKAMARAGLCSRRDAEAWILDGRVSVNGDVLASPARDVGPDDRVEVDGVPLPTAEKTRLFLFHKPRGLVTSDHDPEGRVTIFDHLRDHWPEGPRVVTVGRLDINTEGLLLLTNDGGLARMLELPKTGWLRRYRVRANGETDQAKLDALADGISIDGVDYAGIEAKLDRVQGANCWLTMGLREGKNREIKRVLEHLGLEVNRLIRLSFGPFQLLDIAEGAVEEVRTRVLKDQLGAALASEAGVDFGDAPVAPAEPARVVKEARTSAAASAAVAPRKDRAAPDRATPSRAPRTIAGDPRPQQSRAGERGGERTLRRRDAPAPLAQDHNIRKPRRHVSTLRTTEAAAERDGPRKRIERSDTRDRNDRAVAVERKVSARPARSLSPAAEGKRARIARSGATRRDAMPGAGREGAGEGRRGGDARSTERGGQRPTRFGQGGDRSRDARRGGDGAPGRSGARPPRSAPRADAPAARDGTGAAGRSGTRPPRAAPRADTRSTTRADGRGTDRDTRPRRDDTNRSESRPKREPSSRDAAARSGPRPVRRDGAGGGSRTGAGTSGAGRPRSAGAGGSDRPAHRPAGGAGRPSGDRNAPRGGGRPDGGKGGGKGGGARPPRGAPDRPKR